MTTTLLLNEPWVVALRAGREYLNGWWPLDGAGLRWGLLESDGWRVAMVEGPPGGGASWWFTPADKPEWTAARAPSLELAVKAALKALERK